MVLLVHTMGAGHITDGATRSSPIEELERPGSFTNGPKFTKCYRLTV